MLPTYHWKTFLQITDKHSKWAIPQYNKGIAQYSIGSKKNTQKKRIKETHTDKTRTHHWEKQPRNTHILLLSVSHLNIVWSALFLPLPFVMKVGVWCVSLLCPVCLFLFFFFEPDNYYPIINFVLRNSLIK